MNSQGAQCGNIGRAYNAAREMKEDPIMAQQNEHIKKLLVARDNEVVHRREVAAALAAQHQRGHEEDMRVAIVSIQNAIEAIDSAIADEKLISSDTLRGI